MKAFSGILVCRRVAEFEPRLESVVTSCDKCGEAIWLALSSPLREQIICMQCFKRYYASDPNIEIEPMTKRQRADLKRAPK